MQKVSRFAPINRLKFFVTVLIETVTLCKYKHFFIIFTKKKMKNVIKIQSLIIIGLIIYIFLFQKCENTKTIVVPKIVEKFFAVKPDTITITKTEFKTKLVKEYNYNEKEVENLATEIAHLESIADSLAYSNHELSEIVSNYAKINEFKTTFSDDNVIVNVSGITFKNIAERVKIDYEIKERKIEVPKQTAFKILFGGSIGNDKSFNNFVATGNFGFQNSSGKVFILGYDTESRFSVGLLLPLGGI